MNPRWRSIPGLRVFIDPRFRELAVLVMFLGALALHGLDFKSALANMRDGGADITHMFAATHDTWSGPHIPPAVLGPPHVISSGAQAEAQYYPPTFFLLMGPWLLVGGAARDVIWLLVLDCALVLAMVVVYAGVGRPSRMEALLAGSMVLLLFPVRENLHYGQVDLLLALAMVLAWLGAQRRRAVLGGTALGLAIAAKLHPLLLLPYLVWRRKYLVTATALLVVGILGATTLALGWGARWPVFVGAAHLTSRGTAAILNESFNGVLMRAWRPDLDAFPIPESPMWLYTLWYGLALLLVALTFLAIRHVRLPQPEQAWTEFAIVLLALPLLQPFAWFSHHAAALVAVIMGIRLARRGMLSGQVAAWGVMAYVLSTVVARLIYMSARSMPSIEVTHNPWLVYGSSMTVFAVLLAILVLSRANSAQIGRRSAISR